MNKDRQLKYFSKYMFNRTYLFPKSIVIKHCYQLWLQVLSLPTWFGFICCNYSSNEHL